jgi:putative peptidoglycan lipid II flippase
VFTFVFGNGIVELLFTRGAFDDKATREVVWALSFYAWGIPLFSTSKILVAGFYAHKEMKKPVRIAVACVCLNIVLNLVLMWPLRQGGIALATVTSSLMGNILLALGLRRLVPETRFSKIAVPAARACVAAAAAAVAAYYSIPFLKPVADRLTAGMPVRGAETLPAAAVFAAAYFAVASLAAAKEPGEWLAILKRRSRS